MVYSYFVLGVGSDAVEMDTQQPVTKGDIIQICAESEEEQMPGSVLRYEVTSVEFLPVTSSIADTFLRVKLLK